MDKELCTEHLFLDQAFVASHSCAPTILFSFFHAAIAAIKGSDLRSQFLCVRCVKI